MFDPKSKGAYDYFLDVIGRMNMNNISTLFRTITPIHTKYCNTSTTLSQTRIQSDTVSIQLPIWAQYLQRRRQISHGEKLPWLSHLSYPKRRVGKFQSVLTVQQTNRR